MNLFASMKSAGYRSSHGNCERVGRAPAVNESAVESVRVHTPFPCPLSKGLNTPVKPQSSVNPLVIVLLFLRGPYAILRRIARFIPESFQRITIRRSTAHISNKIPKGRPSFTDSNSPPAVVFIAWVRSVLAPLVNGLPCVIFRGVSESVFREASTYSLSAIATTGNIRPAKRCGPYVLLVSAITQAKPVGLTSSRKREIQHGITSESLSGNIFNRHGVILLFQGDNVQCR